MSVFVSVSLAALAITLPPGACLAVHSAHARGPAQLRARLQVQSPPPRVAVRVVPRSTVRA
jgi:hypothetical protein